MKAPVHAPVVGRGGIDGGRERGWYGEKIKEWGNV